MIKLVLPLAPVAWERVDRGRYGQAYVPAKTRAFKRDCARLARAAYHGPVLDVPLRLTFRFLVARPKRPKFKHAPGVRPDADNYLKALKDALNGVLWADDALICEYGAGSGKFYDLVRPEARIELTVERLEER